MYLNGHFISAFDINNTYYIVEDLGTTSESRCQTIFQRSKASNIAVSSSLYYLINLNFFMFLLK